MILVIKFGGKRDQLSLSVIEIQHAEELLRPYQFTRLHDSFYPESRLYTHTDTPTSNSESCVVNSQSFG